MLLVLDQQDARALTDHEAIALDIEGATGALWGVVAPREGMHVGEGGYPHWRDAALRAAGDHRDGIATADHLRSLADGIGAGCAGRDGGKIGSARADLHRDKASGDVCDEHGDKERADTVRPAVEERLELIVAGGQPPNT